VRERALDVRDVCLGALGRIYGLDVAAAPAPPDADWVLVAGRLTPGQLLAVDRRRLRGLVLAHGGATSHTVILARSFGLPTLVGLADIVPASLDGTSVVVDADLGVLVSDLTDAARRYYALEQAREAGRRAWVRQFRSGPAVTADGRRLEIGANIGSAADVALAIDEGAEGVGVFRTETLFQGRREPPSEDEQFEEYRAALEAAGDRPVIIRTLDVGGDKPMPYLRLPAEENPFLGYRAIRIYPEFEALVRAQVRALVRASAFGNLKVMLPMVTSVDEVRWVRHLVAEERAAASAAGHPYDAAMAVGAMIEVPAAALTVDRLCAHVDFFSIGTNDLLQYFAAADRSNPRVAELYDPLHPGFIRLLRTVVAEARAGGRWVGLCGEMGGAVEYLPLLAGLGLDEISVSVPRVGPIRATLAQLSAAACDLAVERASACDTASEAARVLSEGAWSAAAPLVDADLVALDVDARSKAEAIKIAVDRLAISGRTDRPGDVEDAVRARESASSTGFGHGFSVPHAKTDAVRCASLVLLRLRNPVAWGSIDDAPVSTVLLLAMPASHASDQHLRVLAALSRRLMHEDFRARLSGARDVDAACAVLREALGIQT
jgi:phosphoenolpyruvate-protein phosphotransferase